MSFEQEYRSALALVEGELQNAFTLSLIHI